MKSQMVPNLEHLLEQKMEWKKGCLKVLSLVLKLGLLMVFEKEVQMVLKLEKELDQKMEWKKD